MNDVSIITKESINEFEKYLHAEERSSGTIEKYMRDVRVLAAWLNATPLTKEVLSAWKETLKARNYQPSTVNSMLASVNTYCRLMKIEYRVRFLRVQKKLFREEEKNLTQKEYERLIGAAQTHGKNRLALLLETIGSTGIRVSEVKNITVEAARSGKTQVILKGKIRIIMLPKALRKKLLQYARKEKIVTGEVFRTRNGTSLSRKQIWAEMKSICRDAGVMPSKVFPHNLRHLFARVYYRVTHDAAKLADLLGHSSIDTTRIYLLSSGAEHERQLEMLGLVL